MAEFQLTYREVGNFFRILNFVLYIVYLYFSNIYIVDIDSPGRQLVLVQKILNSVLFLKRYFGIILKYYYYYFSISIYVKTTKEISLQFSKTKAP